MPRRGLTVPRVVGLAVMILLGGCAATNPIENATTAAPTAIASAQPTIPPATVTAAVANVQPSTPEATNSVWLDQLTSPEVAARIAAGWTTIVIPTGGTEQNGPHLALGKHNVVVGHTAEQIARRSGQTLVAPVMHYVPEGDLVTMSGHLQWAGTISIPADVFGNVLRATTESLVGHGFTTIAFVGDSGSTQETQAQVAAELNQRWPGVTVSNLNDYYSANGQIDWLLNRGIPQAAIGTHAGARDTSEVLAVAPGLVRMELAGVGASPGTLDVDGRDGDATLANADWGNTLLELKIAAGVAEIERLRSTP